MCGPVRLLRTLGSDLLKVCIPDQTAWWVGTGERWKIGVILSVYNYSESLEFPHGFSSYCAITHHLYAVSLMFTTISEKKLCSVRLYAHLLWRVFMFYLCYLYLFMHTCVQHYTCIYLRWLSCNRRCLPFRSSLVQPWF